ncbi:MAG TPA: glycerol-3-phosphate 1-O-acyltransferase PlsY [Usitatibacter sp.]|nr:glycerol-3-phosphate 1-O-acyltransferase PlsY [Usitatibacter sp.]
MTAFLCALGGYLAGSIPFAVLVSRLMRLPDPRSYGSRNIGATNVLRSGNRVAALLTLVGDAAKGWAAVLVARLMGLPLELLALVGFAAFVGHVFPVWLRFQGGKGVATAAGVLIAFDWRLGLAVIVAWLTVAVVSRYSSLASLTAALFAPAAAWHLSGNGPVLWAVIAMSILLFARHHANIRKLVRGEESRIGEKKKAPVAHGEATP